MTTLLDVAPVPERAVPADDRGLTTVADRAVARLATCALAEVDKVGGAARTVLGIAVGSGAPDGDAIVSARISGATVALTVRLSVSYPTSVREATEQARDHLVVRVGALTGLTVETVDITVTALHSDATNVRRVL